LKLRFLPFKFENFLIVVAFYAPLRPTGTSPPQLYNGASKEGRMIVLFLPLPLFEGEMSAGQRGCEYLQLYKKFVILSVYS